MGNSSHAFESDGADCSAPIPRAPRGGDLVGQKYLLVRVLGEGGMGLVFEAVHLKLQIRVAIKFLRPAVLAMPDARARFEREARATGRIRDDHIASVIDVDTTSDGIPYIVMELLQGNDLEAELCARPTLPLAEAVDYVLQACAAISAAHGVGVVHRDLKPSNLFLTWRSGHRLVKVLDFGISKILGDPSATTAFMSIGTPLYMSPEQVRSSKDVDGRSDVWSLGVILYELIAGSPPFKGTTTAAIAAIVADATPSLRAVCPEVPDALERVLATALAKDAKDRFPTVEAFAAALIPFASSEGVAGPYAYRPSEEAFRVASSTLALAPRGAESSSVHSLQLGFAARRTPPSRGRWLAGSVVFALSLAAAATLVTARSFDRSAQASTGLGHGAAAATPEPRPTIADLGSAVVAPAPPAATSAAPRLAPRAAIAPRRNSASASDAPNSAGPTTTATAAPHARGPGHADAPRAVVHPLYL